MTMTKQEATKWAQEKAHPFVGKNCRRFFAGAYTGEAGESALGFPALPGNFEGTVVLIEDGMVLLKESTNKFKAIPVHLLTEQVDVGDKAAFVFYKATRFDGSAADGSDDPAVNGIKTFSLGFQKTYIPVRFDRNHRDKARITKDKDADLPHIQNPYLIDMIEQMEEMRVDGGLRNVANIIKDAGATNIRFVDPLEEESADTAPALVLDMDNKVCQATVTVLYRRVPDCYEIQLQKDGEVVAVTQEIFFDQLGSVLIDMIDDGAWKMVKTTILKRAKKAKVAAAVA